MASLEQNQARMLAALKTLEDKVAALKNNDPLRAENATLKSQVSELETKAAALHAAGVDATKDLEMAIGQIEALQGGASHG